MNRVRLTANIRFLLSKGFYPANVLSLRSTATRVNILQNSETRKCGLFGLNSEGLHQQVNYLIDEAHSSGKGANAVISYLHDYLKHHSLGEKELHLHADNCAGQNKNNFMVWYLLWRCMVGLNEQIILNFLIAGHTKFSQDGGFGFYMPCQSCILYLYIGMYFRTDSKQCT